MQRYINQMLIKTIQELFLSKSYFLYREIYSFMESHVSFILQHGAGIDF